VGSIPSSAAAWRGVNIQKSGDGEIPRSGRLRCADGLIVAVMAGKQVGNYATACCKITNPVQGARAF
jgi:hypothetical protein